MKKEDCILFSGGIKGAEEAFGINAERYGIEEVNFSFEGHDSVRRRGIRILTQDELKEGDVSFAYISKLMNRHYPKTATFRKVLQSIWYQINSGREIFVVGHILDDKTVKGGTGWGAEFAKLCNKPLYVFDQSRDGWFAWNQTDWLACEPGNEPVISQPRFTGTGTRYLEANGKQAIAALFERTFG